MFIFPVSFNNVFSYAAVKDHDYGGGIPNIVSVTKTAMQMEYEWVTWANGIGMRQTSSTPNMHIIVIGN